MKNKSSTGNLGHEMYSSKNRSVLIVDDDSEIRAVLKDLITSVSMQEKGAKIEVDFASNGLDGMKKMWVKTYGLLISDYVMPKLDGNNMLETLKRLHANNLPENILVISGYHDKLKELKKNNDKLITMEKPFRPDDIKNLILSIFYI